VEKKFFYVRVAIVLYKTIEIAERIDGEKALTKPLPGHKPYGGWQAR
jgi:hypothetical protein